MSRSQNRECVTGALVGGTEAKMNLFSEYGYVAY